MKIKSDFVLRSVGGQSVVVATGDTSRTFHGVVRLNEVGAFLWKNLEEETDEETLVSRLCGEYSVEEATARRDVSAFLSRLREAGLTVE